MRVYRAIAVICGGVAVACLCFLIIIIASGGLRGGRVVVAVVDVVWSLALILWARWMWRAAAEMDR